MELQFAQALFQCRELSSAIARLTTPETLHAIIKDLISASGGPALLQLGGQSDVSDQLAQVVTLVLKDVDLADYPFPTAPAEAGVQALQGLHQAVFGSNLQPSLMQSVLCGSLAQAQRMLQLCVATLLDSLTPHNCLAVYNVARSCNCEAISLAARAYALQNFSAAAQLDYVGLTMLPAAHLMGFLCSDVLQVASEVEVFSALVAWVESDPAARMHGFARRLAAAVRLSQLTTSDLVYLDSHPLVLKDRMATQLVAHTYLSKMTGLPYDTPFGMRTISRPRHAQQLPQPPTTCSAGALGSGLPAHSSMLPSRRSALAQLVQKLAAEDAGPGTPTPAGTDAAAAPLQQQYSGMACGMSPLGALLGAPTPALRAGSLSPPAMPQQANRARDMRLPANGAAAAAGRQRAARRTLFSAGLPVECETEATPARAGSRGVQGMSSKSHEGQKVAGPRAAASPFAAAGLSGMDIEMMLSPTRTGIRDWLSTTAAPQAAVWTSKKRLRYDD